MWKESIKQNKTHLQKLYKRKKLETWYHHHDFSPPPYIRKVASKNIIFPIGKKFQT